MISINDFVPGDRVHLLERDALAPIILEATVKKVRSGYVWVSPDQTLYFTKDRTFCLRNSTDSFLTEDDQTGWGSILFRSRADAERMLLQVKEQEHSHGRKTGCFSCLKYRFTGKQQ